MPRLAPPIRVAPDLTAVPPRPAGPVTLGDALARWERYLNTSERVGSQRTIESYLKALDKLVDRLGSQYELHAITPDDVRGLLADAKERGLKPASRSAIYRPIRTFMRWAVREGLIPVAPTDRVDAPHVPDAPVEYVTDAEWQAVLATCRVPRSGFAFRPRRDLAILLILGTTGARLSEVAGMRLGDIDGDTVLVHGKGGKDRLLPLLPEAVQALRTYLTLERPRSPFSTGSDVLWLASKGPFTSAGIAQMVRDRGRGAGIARSVHPHELRHRFVSQTLAAGMPAPLVMALTGHTTPSMLNRYGAFGRAQDAMAMWRELSAKRQPA